jgi:hypothetical protein
MLPKIVESRTTGAGHIVDFIDYDTGLIVDFETITRDNHYSDSDYISSANGMEAWDVRQMISRWIGNRKAKCIVRDEASKSGKVIRDSGGDRIQILDPNHCIKAFGNGTVWPVTRDSISMNRKSDSSHSFGQ